MFSYGFVLTWCFSFFTRLFFVCVGRLLGVAHEVKERASNVGTPSLPPFVRLPVTWYQQLKRFLDLHEVLCRSCLQTVDNQT